MLKLRKILSYEVKSLPKTFLAPKIIKIAVNNKLRKNANALFSNAVTSNCFYLAAKGLERNIHLHPSVLHGYEFVVRMRALIFQRH